MCVALLPPSLFRWLVPLFNVAVGIAQATVAPERCCDDVCGTKNLRRRAWNNKKQKNKDRGWVCDVGQRVPGGKLKFGFSAKIQYAELRRHPFLEPILVTLFFFVFVF